ncbi:MAG: 1-deoxy-D-xylulose-5-phosphate reductoisomerase [Proteobacteria bacterium]|nr:1-deoxy-D-xylulose-5-phosphate reductoisomerase [Pseudomonadota bacterium]
MDMNPAKFAPETDTGPRCVTILGSTGSVGSNTVDLIERNPSAFVVEALTANRNVKLLAEQARRLNPKTVVLADPEGFKELQEALADTDIAVAAGPEAVIEAADQPADLVMASIVGAAGLKPTLAAIRRGATIGLANKECLVSAGEVFVKEVSSSGATLLPVDSEHSAIFQVFDFANADRVQRIILTASGGPFREFSLAEMAKVTPEQAVKHPNWDMGAKISVDSATMMNKGLELIEAHHLFTLPSEKIEVVIHPQSVVHSLVAYVDGSVLAQLGPPDMRTPIAYTLGWPARIAAPTSRLNLAEIGQLTFEAPDETRFPALRLARESLQIGDGAPTVLSAANEVAVNGFLTRKIGFLDIVRIVERTLERIPLSPLGSLDDVTALDKAARVLSASFVEGA